MKGFFRSAFFLSVVILLSFWTVKPLFTLGFFPMHDDTQVSRVYEMAKALSYGQFPVRWVGDLGYGYGYPLFNFYAPLPYYIGAVFTLVGFDALAATKIMFFVGIVFAVVTMFFLLKNIVAEIGTLVGSLLYTYAPYHAVDVYVRGAVGEFYAIAFLPLVLLGIIKILGHKKQKDLKSGIIIGSLGIAGVFLSHNILGMIAGYFLILFLLILFIVYLIPSPRGSPFGHPRGAFKTLLFTFLLGFALSAFFTLPAIFEKNFTRVNELTSGSSNFTNHFVYLDQLWSSPWGFAGSAPGRADGMSFMIGKIHLLLGLLAIPITFILYRRKKITRFHTSLITFLLLLFTLSVFLMLDISKPIWDLLPGFAFIQYPWRFLVFSIFSLSIITPVFFLLFKKKTQIVLGIFLIGTIVWFNSKYFTPKQYFSSTAQDYTNPSDLRYKISKISDEYLPNDFFIPQSIKDISWQGLVDGYNLKIMEAVDYPTKKIYKITVSEGGKIVTNIAYFPGWQAKIDGKSSRIDSQNGRITLFLPEGDHMVEFDFANTPIRTIANTISIFSLFLIVYIIVSKKRIYAREKNS